MREKEGLSYDVRTQVIFNPHEASSLFTGSAIFAPSNRARVEAAFMEELQRSVREPFTIEEVSQAKQGVLNFRRLARAQDDGLAGTLANNAFLGRDFMSSQKLDEEISRVTPESAMAAWRKHIRPADLVIAVGGDFKGR